MKQTKILLSGCGGRLGRAITARIADRDEKRLGIVNFEKTATPEIFSDGEETRTFDWSRIYDGSRSQLSWME